MRFTSRSRGSINDTSARVRPSLAGVTPDPVSGEAAPSLRLRAPEHARELGHDRVAPRAIARLGQVQEVGHRLLPDRSVLLDEPVADAHEAHLRAVVEPR